MYSLESGSGVGVACGSASGASPTARRTGCHLSDAAPAARMQSRSGAMTAAFAHLTRAPEREGFSLPPAFAALLFLFDTGDLPRPRTDGAPLTPARRDLLKTKEDENLAR